MITSSTDKIKCLFSWCLNQTDGYKNVSIKNFTTSWRNGLGFCAILHRYGPEFIEFDKLNPENVYENCQLAFEVAEQHFGIPALLDAKDMEIMNIPDRLSILTYLFQCYSTLSSKQPNSTIVGGPLSSIENISDENSMEYKENGSKSFESLHDQHDQLLCEICSKSIYFLEKLSVKEKYYHRSCYRASQLEHLKIRNKTLERPNTNSNDLDINNISTKSKSVSPENKKNLSLKTDENESNDKVKITNIHEGFKSSSDDKKLLSTKDEVKTSHISSRVDILRKENKVNRVDLEDVKGNKPLEVSVVSDDNKLLSYKSYEKVVENNNDGEVKSFKEKETEPPEIKGIPNMIIDELKPELMNKNINDKSVSIMNKRVINNNNEFNSTSGGIIKKEIGDSSEEFKSSKNKDSLNLGDFETKSDIIVENDKKRLPVSESKSSKEKIHAPNFERFAYSNDELKSNKNSLYIGHVETKSDTKIQNDKKRSPENIDKALSKRKSSKEGILTSNAAIRDKPRISRLRSFSPNTTYVRPPSLDSHLDEISSEKLNEQSNDQSLPSASSLNAISINASSSDSIPKCNLQITDSLKEEFINTPGKLLPNSLNTSISSLNSSFSKKRRAPPPPLPPLLAKETESIRIRPSTKRTISLKPESIYPENLNPFGLADDKHEKHDSNPFAEFMTDQSGDKPKTVKPIPKPRKRTAPKLPLKLMIDVNPNNIEDIQIKELPDKKNNTLIVIEDESSHSITGFSISVKKENVPQKTTSLLIKDSSSTINTESLIKDTYKKKNDLIKLPEPVKKQQPSIEKAKSNDAINIMLSSERNEKKPPVQSRPAPPRPHPQKRKVRSDKNDEFIPFDLLYKELKEVNEGQSDMESKGRSLQDALNKVNENDEGYESLLQEWLEIVEKKNVMYTREHYLHEVLRRQELEERHSDLEFELRVLMGKQESLKTAAEKARENELIYQILDTVNARAKMAEKDDEESSDRSSSKENLKKKSHIKKLFNTKARSNSVGKILFRFKNHKNKSRTDNSIFYDPS